jgi:hypothetical protein
MEIVTWYDIGQATDIRRRTKILLLYIYCRFFVNQLVRATGRGDFPPWHRRFLETSLTAVFWNTNEGIVKRTPIANTIIEQVLHSRSSRSLACWLIVVMFQKICRWDRRKLSPGAIILYIFILNISGCCTSRRSMMLAYWYCAMRLYRYK